MASIATRVIDVLTGGIGKKIGDVVDKLVPDKDLNAKLKHELDMAALVSQTDLEKIEIEAERDIEVEIQKTHQAELNQADIKTKRTRPMIARMSWYVTMAYGVSYIVPNVVPMESIATFDFEWQVFIAMATPALTYMGVRGFDKWKGNG